MMSSAVNLEARLVLHKKERKYLLFLCMATVILVSEEGQLIDMFHGKLDSDYSPPISALKGIKNLIYTR